MCTVRALTSAKYPPVVTPSVCNRPPLRKVISLFSSSVSISQAHASDSVRDASHVQWLWSRWSGGTHGVHSWSVTYTSVVFHVTLLVALLPARQ